MDQGVMASKSYFKFPKASGFEPYHQIVQCHIRTLIFWWVSYPSVKIQSVCSSPPSDWVVFTLIKEINSNLLVILQIRIITGGDYVPALSHFCPPPHRRVSPPGRIGSCEFLDLRVSDIF